LLERDNPSLIDEANVKIKKIDSDKFEVTGKPKNIYKFMNMLIPYIKKCTEN
jgi:hypothetical protein